MEPAILSEAELAAAVEVLGLEIFEVVHGHDNEVIERALLGVLSALMLASDTWARTVHDPLTNHRFTIERTVHSRQRDDATL